MEMENREVHRGRQGWRRRGPGIRVHWPICGATTPVAPGSDALQVMLVVPRIPRTLRHTPIFSYVLWLYKKVYLKRILSELKKIEMRYEFLRGFETSPALLSKRRSYTYNFYLFLLLHLDLLRNCCISCN